MKNNFAKLRKKVNISQYELAKMLEIKQSTVAMWESGTNKPRAEKLPVIAKILKCTIDELLSEK